MIGQYEEQQGKEHSPPGSCLKNVYVHMCVYYMCYYMYHDSKVYFGGGGTHLSLPIFLM